MNEELIAKIKSLNSVAPNADWVALNKQKLFASAPEPAVAFFPWLAKSMLRPVTYGAMAVLALAAVGTFFLPQIPTPSASPQRAVAAASVANSLQELKVKAQTLQNAVAMNPESAPQAASEVKAVEQKLTDLVKSDPSSAKAVAVGLQSNQTLLSTSNGDDLKPTTDDLYKATDKSLLDSLQQETLTPDQQQSFSDAQNLYIQGNYVGALEKILLINHTD